MEDRSSFEPVGPVKVEFLGPYSTEDAEQGASDGIYRSAFVLPRYVRALKTLTQD